MHCGRLDGAEEAHQSQGDIMPWPGCRRTTASLQSDWLGYFPALKCVCALGGTELTTAATESGSR